MQPKQRLSHLQLSATFMQARQTGGVIIVSSQGFPASGLSLRGVMS
jgi:hypothetical protein